MRKSVIFIFLDGFGLGERSEINPIHTFGISSLEKSLKTKLIYGASVQSDQVFIRGIDAVLGIDGIPQSATGQTSLLTGVNAQAELGFHLPAFPNDKLVEIIEKQSILKTLYDSGLTVTFANAYTENYFKRANGSHSVTTHCVRAAGLPYRMISDLMKNDAVYWDISRAYLEKRTGVEYAEISPFEAGIHLINIAKDNDFVLFECFEPDLIGHATDCESARLFLCKLDMFIDGILKTKGKHMSIVICSDHGNMENCSRSSHTENPVPLIAIGPIAESFGDINSIDQVTPAIVKYLTKSI